MPLRVAVMGCVVNGPGEAREADLGVASGNGKGQIFVRGEVIKTVPESQIVETLIEEAMKLAERQRRTARTASRQPRSPSQRPPASAGPAMRPSGERASRAASGCSRWLVAARPAACIAGALLRQHRRLTSAVGGQGRTAPQARRRDRPGTKLQLALLPRAARTSMRCASLQVPLDYRHPGRAGRSRWRCPRCRPPPRPRKRQGILLVNPGGPGGSGLSAWPRSSPRAWTHGGRRVQHHRLRPTGRRVQRARAALRPRRSSPGCGPTTSRRTPGRRAGAARPGQDLRRRLREAGTAGCCRS